MEFAGKHPRLMAHGAHLGAIGPGAAGAGVGAIAGAEGAGALYRALRGKKKPDGGKEKKD